MKYKLLAVSVAFGAFVVSGPLQHIGVLPETVVGDASKALTEAFASCGGGNRQGNNGFGNGGFDGVPGNSVFQDLAR